MQLRFIICFIIGILLFAFSANAAPIAPIISNEELTSLTDSMAVITWVTTNESATTEVHYGINAGYSRYATNEAGTKYHYAIIQGLNPGTTYKYYVKSGSTTGLQKTFTTLTPPSGQYLFSFATLADPQYAIGKADTHGARGRPYSKSKEILEQTVSMINRFTPAFTILKGDLIESEVDLGDTPYGNYVNTAITGDTQSIKDKLDALTKAIDSTYKYYPIPGNHDKTPSAYTGGTTSSWYNDNLKPLFPGKTVSSPTQDSCFNYSFNYGGYHFIMLDSVKSNLSAEVNAAYLSSELASAETLGQKCFIFLHHPVTDLNEEGIPIDVIKEITGGTDDYAKIQIMNTVEVQSIITTYKDSIMGVFSGHIHDNSYKKVAGVPCVRTAAGLQFPTGFNIYKVYSNGFMQSFYKVPTLSEYARTVVTPEAGYSDAYWEQFSLGPNNARNFSHTLSAAKPGVSSVTPVNGETSVPVNENIIIRFTKAMDQSETQNAITISPSVGGKSYSWQTSDTLVISHSNFAASTVHAVTIGIEAKDLTGQAISAYSFNFTTSAISDAVPPVASFDKLVFDMTSQNQPVLSGIATDELSQIVSIECRIDGGNWVAANPIDQILNSKQEGFYYSPSQALARSFRPHLIEVRCLDAAQNINTTYESYSFYVIGDKPEIGVKANGLDIISGDPIEKTPSFEITVISNKGLTNPLYAIIDNGTAVSLTKEVNPSNSGIVTALYKPSLSDGIHSIRISIFDDLGNASTREVIGLVVQSTAEAAVQGTPLSYPNPYSGTGNVSLSYILSKSGGITLTIHDLLGNQLARKTFASGADGGKAGYNEVVWNGRTDAGEELGNGIYVYLIIGEGKILGKGKLAVAK